MKAIHVVGARPNFIKLAPLVRAMKKRKGKFISTIVHTGQHYDENMSRNFFMHLGIPEPDLNLGIGSGSHAEQTGKIMMEFEKILLKAKPDIVLVYGDVNSTIACALASSKLGIPVAHVEAGLRSFDRTMPEEINRILTDAISDFLFTTEKSANQNLKKEGISEEKTFYVGNIMIDTLRHCLEKIKDTQLPFNDIKEKRYAVITLHRPSNVDNPEVLSNTLKALHSISKRLKLVIPLHPRTKRNIEAFGLQYKLKQISKNAQISSPIGYLEMLTLIKSAKLVITDSGGIQEETTYLRIPCITMRENTERPVTVNMGTNVLVGNDSDALYANFRRIMSGRFKKGRVPPLWDGNTAKRIVEVLLK